MSVPTPDRARLLNDPKAWLDAHATLSATLLCGCTWPPSDPEKARLLITPGHQTDCAKHGATLVIRTTLRLVNPHGAHVKPEVTPTEGRQP